jgi:hypothetical protein
MPGGAPNISSRRQTSSIDRLYVKSFHARKIVDILSEGAMGDMEEDDEEPLAFIEEDRTVAERRKRRQLSTQPATFLIRDGRNHDKGTIDNHRTVLDVVPQQNWTRLCSQARMDSSSAVLLSEALSHPLGHALALLLGKQCDVNRFLVVDSMYPPLKGSERLRLAQLERYKVLKRALPSIQLVTPQLIMPSAAVREPPSHSLVDKAMNSFAPSHVVHLDLTERLYPGLLDEGAIQMYSYRAGLKALDNILRVQAANKESRQNPRLVYVTARNMTDSPLSQMQSILARAYYRQRHTYLVQLELPTVYGPLVDGVEAFHDPHTNSPDLTQLLYVEEAISSILQAFAASEASDAFTALRANSVLMDVLPPESFPNDDKVWIEERVKQNQYRIKETRAWEQGEDADDNSEDDADYLDLFGVPETLFPCSSGCESARCQATALDTVRSVTHELTSRCDYVLYVVDTSRSFTIDDLHTPKKNKKASEYPLCRLAFVSSQSQLARMQMLSSEDYETGEHVSIEKVEAENGKHVVKGWTLIWLYDFTNNDKALVAATLRIDPSGLFHHNVVKALYTELPGFMRANERQLETTFDDMTRRRTGKRYAEVPRKGLNGLTKVLVPSQKSRKAVFYAREPKPENLPHSLEDFVLSAQGELPWKQIEFYEDSAGTIPTPDTRTTVANPDLLMQHDDSSTSDPTSVFPYQWLSTVVYVHDLQMSISQELRCRWLREYLFWGGESKDAEVLSFAYIIGKLHFQGLVGSRLVNLDEAHWIPLLNPSDPSRRLRNSEDWEVFMLIMVR